ncbi:MAG: FAD:protein FMN transferase [Candidatus Woesearchaeota archaeon]
MNHCEALGTRFEFSCSFFGPCVAELQRIEQKYSRFIPSSMLSSINSNIGHWVRVDKECVMLIEQALRIQQETQGYFSLFVKNTLDALGYDAQYSFTPQHVATYAHNVIDIDGINVRAHAPIDFGGFGKGWALDQLALLCQQDTRFYLNGGGDIIVKDAWPILLEHPDDTTKTIGKITLYSQAFASSAPNRRKWKHGHHLINPKTNTPQQTMKAVYVVAETALLADAYATALFCAGFEQALVLAQRLPVQCMLISVHDKVYTTDAFFIEQV